MIIHLAEPCSTALLKENIDSKRINVGYRQRHVCHSAPSWDCCWFRTPSCSVTELSRINGSTALTSVASSTLVPKRDLERFLLCLPDLFA